MFYTRPKVKGLDFRHKALTPLVLRQIIRKMQYRSQAVLSMTSRFGKAVAETYGPQLVYVKGFLNGALMAPMSRPPTKFIWEVAEQPMCVAAVQKDDVIVVYNNLDVTEMPTYIDMEGLYYSEGYEQPNIIIRRPRPEEILTLPIEYPLYDQSEPGLGFDIPENMPSRRRLIVDRVHWRTDAETAGLNYGDEILTINGENPMFPHYADIIAQLISKSVLQLTVRRIGFEI